MAALLLGDQIGTVVPSHSVLYEGSSVQIVCHSKSLPTWLKNGEPFLNVTYYGIVLLVDLTHNDSGIYTCRGTVHQQQKFNAMSTIYVVGLLVY